jgi:hypothetical protein
MAIVTRDSTGSYRCQFDLRLGATYPTSATYDSLQNALKLRLERSAQ